MRPIAAAVLNGPAAKTIDVPLGFLGKGLYRALLVRDHAELAAAVDVETRSLAARYSLHASLRAGGGFIARFDKFWDRLLNSQFPLLRIHE